MFEKKEVLKKLENVHYCFLPRVKGDDYHLVKKWKIDDDADFHWYKYLRKEGTVSIHIFVVLGMKDVVVEQKFY